MTTEEAIAWRCSLLSRRERALGALMGFGFLVWIAGLFVLVVLSQPGGAAGLVSAGLR